jgi:hypothetical protein
MALKSLPDVDSGPIIEKIDSILDSIQLGPAAS